MTGGRSHLTLPDQGEGRGTPVGQEAPTSPPPFPSPPLSFISFSLSFTSFFFPPFLTLPLSFFRSHQLGLGVEVGVRVGGKGSKGCRGGQWGAFGPIPYTSPWLSIAMATRMYWARGGDEGGGWTGTSCGELEPQVLPQETDGGPKPLCRSLQPLT